MCILLAEIKAISIPEKNAESNIEIMMIMICISKSLNYLKSVDLKKIN